MLVALSFCRFTTYATSAAAFACSNLLGIATSKHQLLRGIMTVAVQEGPAAASAQAAPNLLAAGPQYTDAAALEANVQRAWKHFRSLGSPQWHVAPMVDQSELPFRMLCRAHGAQAAYTPMLHARLFLERPDYRAEHFTTCEADRPLFVQFCANDPQTFVASAKIVQDQCDYIDLNLGCPQRIAKRGFYGSFLMDDLQLVQQLVQAAARQLSTPISCKIRLFSDIHKSIEYAQMLQAAGCSLLAVHGRTREMKDNSAHRADWDAIAAVRAAVRIPVLANGDVRTLADARALMHHTGADGVLSAEPLLMDPALFSPQKNPEVTSSPLETLKLCQEYLSLVAQHPTHLRMVKGHVHKLLPGWLSEFTDIRDKLNRDANNLGIPGLQQLVEELGKQIAATGRNHPIPKISDRKMKQMEREAAKAAAIAEQQREAAALSQLVPATVDVATEAAQAAGAAAAQGDLVQRQQQQVVVVGALHQVGEPASKRHCADVTAQHAGGIAAAAPAAAVVVASRAIQGG